MAANPRFNSPKIDIAEAVIDDARITVRKFQGGTKVEYTLDPNKLHKEDH